VKFKSVHLSGVGITGVIYFIVIVFLSPSPTFWDTTFQRVTTPAFHILLKVSIHNHFHLALCNINTHLQLISS